MNRMFMQSVTLLRAEYVSDRYGNPGSVRDWPNAVRTTVTGISVQPGQTEEGTGDRQTLNSVWYLRSPRGRDLDILPTDRVEHEGITLEVDGEVGRYSLGGTTHHVEVRLRRVTG